MFSPPNVSKNIAEEGDLIVIYAGMESMHPVTLKKGETYCHKVGAFRHDHIIGKPYGSKIKAVSKAREGYCYILKPSPDLWSNGPLVHRTQIIYPLDISQIIFNLEITPSKTVIESGTGSGSLSIGFARALYPNGKLHTFEFHEERATCAREHFASLQLSEIIEVHCQDVCANGFTPVSPGTADAVFLDLPSPWLAAEKAFESLKENGSFCSFSPCIEQVQLTCDKLRQLNFNEIRIVETLLRPFGVTKYNHVPISNNNNSRKKSFRSNRDNNNNNNEVNIEAIKVEDVSEDVNMSEKVLGKRKEADESTSQDPQHQTTIESINAEPPQSSTTSKFRSNLKLPTVTNDIISTRPVTDIRGHTSYLIFARKPILSS